MAIAIYLNSLLVNQLFVIPKKKVLIKQNPPFNLIKDGKKLL